MKNSLFKLFAAAVVMLSLLLSVAIGGGVGSSSVQAALIPPNLIAAVFLIALIVLPAYVFWRGGETREELRQPTDVICLFVFGAGYACACLQTATLFNPAAQLLVLCCFAIAGMKARTKKFAANQPA